MKTSSQELVELLRRNDAPQEITDRVLLTILPFLQHAASGRLDVTANLVFLDAHAIAEAIATATECRVTDLQIVSAPNPFSDQEDMAPFRYGEELKFDDSLAIRLWHAHWKRSGPQVIARVGYDRKDAYEDAFKSFLRRALGEPAGFRFHDDLSYVPTNPAGESLLTALFYYLAYAGLGDVAAMGDLEPLVRLMTRAIPIGRLTREPGRWIVALLGFAERT